VGGENKGMCEFEEEMYGYEEKEMWKHRVQYSIWRKK
jgi:hypothetical protein